MAAGLGRKYLIIFINSGMMIACRHPQSGQRVPLRFFRGLFA
jgi:hypothetical protein